MKVRLSNIIALLGIGLISAVSVASSNATIIAEFTDGEGVDSVDQYKGIAGNGWANAWDGVTTNDTATPANPYSQVVNVIDDPSTALNGGGKYLKVAGSNNGTTSGNNGFAVVKRSFANFGEVDISLPYVVSFDYRPDVAFTGTSAYERYSILGGSANSTATASTNTWIAVAYSGTGGGDNPAGHGSDQARNWGFLHNTTEIDGTEPSMAAMTFVDSEIDLVAGTVYHFEIEVYPAGKQYIPSVSDGTNSFKSVTRLNFRNEDTPAATASWLHFNLGMLRGNLTSADLGYSVDNIKISLIPEPNSLYLLNMGIVGLITLRRRRKVK